MIKQRGEQWMSWKLEVIRDFRNSNVNNLIYPQFGESSQPSLCVLLVMFHNQYFKKRPTLITCSLWLIMIDSMFSSEVFYRHVRVSLALYSAVKSS